MRIFLAIFAALMAGYLYWPNALRETAYILAEDMMRPGHLFSFIAIGLGLVLLAGRQGRVLFWLWPWLFFGGGVAYIHQYHGNLSPVNPGVFPIFFMFTGCILGVFCLDLLKKRVPRISPANC